MSGFKIGVFALAAQALVAPYCLAQLVLLDVLDGELLSHSLNERVTLMMRVDVPPPENSNGAAEPPIAGVTIELTLSDFGGNPVCNDSSCLDSLSLSVPEKGFLKVVLSTERDSSTDDATLTAKLPNGNLFDLGSLPVDEYGRLQYFLHRDLQGASLRVSDDSPPAEASRLHLETVVFDPVTGATRSSTASCGGF